MASNTIESFLDSSEPLVCISAANLEYIREIVDQCTDEVSWVMEVTELENYIYQIEAVYLPQQRVHGTTTEFEAEDVIHLMENEPNFNPEKWRGWGHSHVNMGVTPSPQDKKQMLEFSKDCDFFVGMIHNKKGEIFCWIADKKRKIFIRDVQVEIESEYRAEVRDLLKSRVSKLVETPKTTAVQTRSGTQASLTPVSLNSVGEPKPFKYNGYNVLFCTKPTEGGTLAYGFDVEGVFFPTTRYHTVKEAVDEYEEILKRIFKDDEEYEPEIPPLHEMEVLDELEDYNRVNHGIF